MRRSIIFVLCAVAALCVAARDRLYINDFNINPGETKQVEIQLDNDTAYTALQADIYLPEGLTIEQEDGEYVFELTSRKARNHTVTSVMLPNGALRFMITSQTLKEFSGNSGAVLTFNLSADDSFNGYKIIELRNIIANEANLAMHYLPNSSCYACQNGTTPPVEGANRLYINSFVINPGETKQIEILLDNVTAFTAIQADIRLPEGLTIEQEDGEFVFDLTPRKARNHIVTSVMLPNGAVRFMITSQTLKEFSGNSGAIVTFNVVADGTFQGVKKVYLENIIATEPDCTMHNLPSTYCYASSNDNVTPVDDKFYIEDFSVAAGSTKQVTINLNNAMPITALQADIYLPNGLTIEQDDGEYLFDLTSRKGSDHTISSNALANGAIRILIASPSLKVISGNTGALVTFNVIATDSFVGPKQLYIRNIVATDKDKNQYDFPDSFCTVNSSVTGDVNGDGVVTSVDITCLYNYLLNGDNTYIATSDVDGDGFISSVDITVIYNILLGN